MTKTMMSRCLIKASSFLRVYDLRKCFVGRGEYYPTSVLKWKEGNKDKKEKIDSIANPI